MTEKTPDNIYYADFTGQHSEPVEAVEPAPDADDTYERAFDIRHQLSEEELSAARANHPISCSPEQKAEFLKLIPEGGETAPDDWYNFRKPRKL